MNIQFICYPRCSTCKDAQKFLNAKGIDFTTQDIKDNPPTKEALKHYHQLSGLPLKRLFNTSGNSYRELGLKDTFDSLTEDEAYELLSKDGMLIKRPIFVFEDKVYFGFKKDELEVAIS